jgi:hypothetical protein
MSDRYKQRILSYYSPGNSREELIETLSAVPPNDAWATFLWLDNKQPTGDELSEQRMRHEFIRANILEIAGKPGEALAMFRTLQDQLKRGTNGGRISDHVAAAIKRLSR